jgi:hypothetical protein
MNHKIIELIQKRLEIGKREYGGEVNIDDGRNWEQEALEEMLDTIVYLSARLIQLKNKGESNMVENKTIEDYEKLVTNRLINEKHKLYKKLTKTPLSAPTSVLNKIAGQIDGINIAITAMGVTRLNKDSLAIKG